MTLDERARRAAAGIHRAVDARDGSRAGASGPIERFERYGATRRRNQRVATAIVAIGLALLAVVFAVRAIEPARRRIPATPVLPSGSILYGRWNQRLQEAHWFTLDTDGSGGTDLHVVASCAEWFPDGSRILITNDADVTPGTPLRPAVVDPDGSNLRSLDGTTDPNLNLGCGDVSADRTRIVLEGFNDENTDRNGIYTVSASDGGDLVRLTSGPDSYPQFSPDGTRVVFMRTKEGVNPDGAGALFVVDAGGGRARRITPWGSAFLDQAWSPDGDWIVFQRPYGLLFLVHPDGTGLHRVPLELPPGAGAREPSWSPDGSWIVFAVQQGRTSNIYVARPDGSRLSALTTSIGGQESFPDWS